MGRGPAGWDKHPEDMLTVCKNGREAIPDTTELCCRARSKDSDFLGVGTHPCGLCAR